MFENRTMEAIQFRNELSSSEKNVTDLIELGYKEYLVTGEVPIDLISKSNLEDLLFYVEVSHKFYLEKSLPQISQSIKNLTKLIGSSHPVILALDHFFHKYYQHLADHFKLEDEMVFPYVRTLVEVQNGEFEKLELLRLCDRFILSSFHDNHSDTEIDIKKVRRAIMEFQPPKIGDSQYRILLDQLQNFEKDLHFHGLIEEEVLIPKALELENVIRS